MCIFTFIYIIYVNIFIHIYLNITYFSKLGADVNGRRPLHVFVPTVGVYFEIYLAEASA